MKRRLVYIFLLGFVCARFNAQNGVTGDPDWLIKPAINEGFILVHHVSIGHLVKGYPTIYELNIAKPTLGNKLWHRENNKPDIGISLQCLDFKNPSQLGYALTMAPFVEIPLNEKEKASRLILRLCWGATYITKCFDIKDDPKNIAIGSHLNAYVQFKWFWQLKISNTLRFEPGFAFTHASNGKSKNPNLGLNVVSINAAFNYLIPSRSRPATTAAIDSSTKVKSKNEILMFATGGFNQRSIGTPRLGCYAFSVAYQRNIRNTHKFSAGLDFFYDENYFIDYENKFNVAPTGLNKLRISARVGYSYNVGRISFPIEVGYYIFQKDNNPAPDAPIVTRLGVRYYTRCGLVPMFGLRTHYAVAYNFEYGLGYRFYIK